ncbi:MAG TPA: hypothetical protein VF620_02845 [Allosphingosinicella sp.]
MIKFAMAASAFMALTTPVSANTSSTTKESVRQATCVKITIRNPDGSGSSEERCTTSSSGVQ